jgi:CTP synthase (UTP-ammonia lyase)
MDEMPSGACMKQVRIALVGDYDASVTAHRAIPLAIDRAGLTYPDTVTYDWLNTDTIRSEKDLATYAGIWCVPASPYRNMDGALLAIRYAREKAIPFFGSCGGFQHAIIEFARNALGWADADHAETAPDANRTVIAPLACALVEVSDQIQLLPNTRLAAAYQRETICEGYRCRFGLNPDFRAALLHGAMRAAAIDDHGEVRAIEIAPHPFFVATLFQPERAALVGEATPIVDAFVVACVKSAPVTPDRS